MLSKTDMLNYIKECLIRTDLTKTVPVGDLLLNDHDTSIAQFIIVHCTLSEIIMVLMRSGCF